jgi:proteasome lid subunit RPN8/RPN11
VLVIPASVLSELLAHLIDGLPDEACGLLAGIPSSDDEPCVVDAWYPSSNQASSSRVYTIDPKVHLRADRDAEDRGVELVGVVHSHTHSEPFPSPTDVAQAPDPAWHYVIVSFRLGQPMVRSYRILEGEIAEEPVLVADR